MPKRQQKKKGRFFAELEKSVAVLQIDKAKLSKTAKKGEAQIDFDEVFKENQTPNSNFKDGFNINS
jgi:SpoU rRNA methylase family enzyme